MGSDTEVDPASPRPICSRLNMLHLYRYQLLRAISPLHCLIWGENTKSQTFCLADINSNGSVLADKFRFVTVQVSIFAGEPQLVAWCSCWANPGLDRLLRVAVSAMSWSEFNDSSELQHCIHKECILDLLSPSNDFDIAHNRTDLLNIMLSLESPKSPLHQVLRTTILFKEKEPLYVVYKDNEWVPATMDGQQRIRCQLCNRQTNKYCSHTNALSSTSMLDIERNARIDDNFTNITDKWDINEENNYGEHNAESYNSERLATFNSRSIDQVPERISGDLQELVRKRAGGQAMFPYQLLPTQHFCRKCNSSLHDSIPIAHSTKTTTSSHSVIFHSCTVIEDVQVFFVDCLHCGRREHYQGNSDGLFNLDDTHLFSYEILYAYLDEQLHLPMTFNGFWKSRIDTYRRLGFEEAKLTKWLNLRNEFQQAVLRFIVLMDIDYEASFDCACHGQNAIVVDGFNMAVRADRLLTFDNPAWQAPEISAKKKGSDRESRLMFNRSIRELLFRFCDKRSAFTSGLSQEEYEEVCRRLEEDDSGYAFLPLFDIFPPVLADKIYKEKLSDLLYADRKIQPFLRALTASVSPVCQLLPLKIHYIVEQLRSRGSLTLSEGIQLARGSPVFHTFVTNILEKTLGQKWPETLKSMLNHLLKKARAPYKDNYSAELDDPSTLCSPYSNSTTEMLKTGYCYPSKPPIRQLHAYQKNMGNRTKSYTTDKGCTKHSKKGGTTGPGSFFVYCGEHRICLGFHLMMNHESPRTIFEILYTRWTTAPRMLVYDNACNACDYFLNREPDFARGMAMASDGMHYNNHKNCSKVFDFRQYSNEYSDVISVLAEIMNSKLANLKVHALFMTGSNFMILTRYYIHRCNERARTIRGTSE